MSKLEEFDFGDLIPILVDNVKEDVKNFEDLINLDGALKREVYIGDITPGTGTCVEGYIRFWNQQDEQNKIPIDEREPIKLYIDSGGGSLTDTLTIIDAIALSQTPVITINIGMAYSGGFFIFICGDHRVAYPYSTFLYHEGSAGQSGDAGKFRNFADFYMKQLDMLKEVVLKHTNISEEFYESIKKDDFWMTAKEAQEHGCCDEIATRFI